MALVLGLAELLLRQWVAPPPVWKEPQTRHIRSPLLGWVLPEGTTSFSIDEPVLINSIGLRDDEFPRKKPAGEKRVLCLGDSFTFALGVAFEDLYSQRLERHLNALHGPTRFQVINAGVAGYNTRQELIYLLAEGFALEPDLIVVGFYWNDLVGNSAPLPDLATPRRVPDAPELQELPHHWIPKPLRDLLRSSLVVYRSVLGAKQVRARLFPYQHEESRLQRALLEGDQEFAEPYWASAGERLRAIAAEAHSRGIPVILMALPMENHVRFSFPAMVWATRLEQIWAPTGMPFVDLEPPFRQALEAGENPFLAYDLHPNPKGMEIVEQQLYRTILTRGFLDLDTEADSAQRPARWRNQYARLAAR